MKNNLTKRWIIVSLIWIGLMIHIYVNNIFIDKIKILQKKAAIFKKETTFVKNHSTRIASVLKMKSTIFKKVESLKLGLLSLKHHFRSIALNFHLNNMKISYNTDIGKKGILPISVSFNCIPNDAVKWLNVVQKECPYIRFRHVTIERDSNQNTAQFTILLYYRYVINSDE